MKFIYIVTSLLILTACRTSKNVDLLSEFREDTKGETQYVSFPKDSILNPIKIACTDSTIALSDIFHPTFLTLYNYKTNKFIGHFINRGTGKDEVNLMTTLKMFGGGLEFWDPNNHKLCTIDINAPNAIKESDFLKKACDNLFKVYHIDKYKSIATGVFPNYPFAVIDNSSDSIIHYFGIYPYTDERENTTKAESPFAYQWYCHYDATSKTMVAATLSGSFISFYDLTDYKKPRLIKKAGNILPQYSKGKKGSVRFLPNNIYGFVDVAGNSKYCVALYWGDTRDKFPHPNIFGGDKLLIYDWNGNAIKKIQLKHIYISLTVHPTLNKIFLVRKNASNMEFSVESIDIP